MASRTVTRTILAACLLALSSTTVMSQNLFTSDREWGDTGGWSIAWNDARQGCFAVTQFESGTMFWFGLADRGRTGFMALANQDWSFADGEKYQLDFTFDDRREWGGEMQGVHIGDYRGVDVSDIKAEFLDEIARSNGVEFLWDGRPLVRLSLKGTRKALNATSECASSAQRQGVAQPNDDQDGVDQEASLAQASTMNDQASTLFGQGDYDRAELLYRRALAILEKALGPEHPDTAASLYNLANVLAQTEDFKGAELLYRRALAIKEKALGPDNPGIIKTLVNLANVLSEQDNDNEAELFYRRALPINEAAFGPDHPNTASNLQNLALLFKQRGDFDGAEPLLRRALAIKEKALGPDHLSTIGTRSNLGNLLAQMGDFDEAEAILRRVLAINEKALGPDAEFTALDLNNLAALLKDRGDPEKAEPLLRRAVAIWKKVLGPEHPGTAKGLNNLAVLLRDRGDYEEAEPLLRRAVAIWKKVLGPEHPTLAQSLNDLAELLLDKGVVSEALDLSRSAAAYGYPDRDSYLRALVASNWPSKPLLDESFSVLQSTSSSEAGTALASLSVRLSAGNSDLARLVRQEQDEASRESNLDKALLTELGKTSEERNPKREEAINAQIAEAKERLTEIRARLASDFPDYAELSQPKPLALEDTQKLLRDDEALVVIDTVKDGQGDYVWVVTTNDATWHKLGTAEGEIDEIVAALLPALNPDNQAEIDLAKAHRLYQLTLGTVEKQISGKKHLLFVLNGAMSSLPPHVLVTRDPAAKTLKDADWLIRNHAVTVLPTVSSLKFLRAGKTIASASQPIRAYADIAYSPGATTGNVEMASGNLSELFAGGIADTRALQGANPLPATGPEARAVTQILGGNVSDIVTGRVATETEVKAANLSDYRVLYFATHGLVAGEVEQMAKVRAEPGLLFAVPEVATIDDDGLLTASEVAQLKLNADWVVLSACNTAAGGKPGAAALSGLARAFFYAGARSLLVSHWPVADDATMELMVRLFETAKANPDQRAAASLQWAMLSIMTDTQNPEWANPAYWAPFILVGEPRS